MSKPCDCGLPAERINAIVVAILTWPVGDDKDILAIAQSIAPPARVSEVNMVFGHLAENHDNLFNRDEKVPNEHRPQQPKSDADILLDATDDDR